MKKTRFLQSFICLLAVSCSVNELDMQVPISSEEEDVFYATLESDSESDTRVYIDEDIKILWDAEDQVSIFNKSTLNQQYQFDGESGDNSGTFSRVPNGYFGAGNDLDYICSVYPFQESATISNSGKLTLTLPAEQTYRTESTGPTFGRGANTMVSVTNDKLLKFKKRKEVYPYALKFFHTLNDSFKDLYGYSEMSDRQIKQYLDMWMPLVDFNLVTGIEDWNTPDHELVGIGITIPSLARALQKCRRGRLLPFGWWHVLRALKFGKTKIVDLLLIGVKPEYRNKGANALMFADLIPWYQKYGYEWGESQVEMETNENVQAQWQALNPIHHKSRRCYKKIL